jgi:hypothetical protein
VSESEPIAAPPPPPAPPHRSSSAKWTAVFLVFIAFGSGILVGFFGEHILRTRFSRHIPPRAAHFLVNRLDRRLDLTDDQKKKIEAIIARRHARMNQIWDSARPRIEAEIEATNNEIASILTPEQRVKFEAIKMRVNRGRMPGRYRTGD